MSLVRLASFVHKWLALLVGIQIVFWVVSGLFFTLFPIKQIRSENLIRPAEAQTIDTATLASLGLAATADHRSVFATLEANGRPHGELVWIDAASFEITRRIEICREPHALAVTPDGAWIYISCRDGHYWVVDGATGEVVRRIETGGRPHNTQISRGGRWAYLSPMRMSEA